LSIKVGDSTGVADVTQVMAAVDWVREHRFQYGLNVRVISLSYGVVSTNDWTKDQLSKTIDKAWEDDMVVVVPAGNNGDAFFDTGLSSPAYNQNVLAIGAYDNVYGTPAYFTSSPNSTNKRFPDVATPGAHITSWRVPNAEADNMVADGLCDPNSSNVYPIFGGGAYIRGSGTSQATAMASGAVALMLSKNPALTADQVKRLLKQTARGVVNGQKGITGDGRVDLTAVFSNPVPSFTQNHDGVTGGGPIERSRGGYHLVDDISRTTRVPSTCLMPDGTTKSNVQPTGVMLCGDYGINGYPIYSTIYPNYVDDDNTWYNSTLGQAWRGDRGEWVAYPAGSGSAAFIDDPNKDANGQPVLGKVWPQLKWSATNWTGQTYLSDTFTGSRWSGSRWSGSRWSGSRWSGSTWRSNSWASAGWK
jgi:serine protease AprX